MTASAYGSLKLLQKLPNGALAFAVPGELSAEEFPAAAEAFAARIGATVLRRDDGGSFHLCAALLREVG